MSAPGLEEDDFDRLFQITCGACGKPAPVFQWCQTPVTGNLPVGD